MATSNWINYLRNKPVAAFAVVFLIAFIVITFFSLRDSKPDDDTPITVVERSYLPVRDKTDSRSIQSSLSSSPQPPSSMVRRNDDTGKRSESIDSPNLDVFATMEFLQEIERDEQGKVIVNSDTLRLLNRAVRTLEGHIDASMMAALAPLIEAEVPGSEGEKVTDIFTKFVEYKSAENDLLAQSGNTDFSSAELLDQTIALRRSYFGAELADQLFKEEEQYLRNTIEAIENSESQPAQSNTGN